MKRIIIGLAAIAAVAGLLPSCESEYTIYEGPAYVMFADTLSVCPATVDGEEFPVTVASLNTCDYDRTYGIEVDAQQSDAVYNWHYTLDKQSVTIPAGQNTAQIHIRPLYDNITEDENPVLALRLVSQFADAWSAEGSMTKVELRKIKPFDIYDFEGYCRVTSTFFIQFGHPIQRIFSCEVLEEEENTLLLKDFYFDNYDIKVRFDVSDPLNPVLEMCGEQVIADTREAFGNLHGDNQILADNAPGYTHLVNLWKRKAETYNLLRVDKVGTVGVFQNLLTWIEDYEVE